jgi:hypothetical protein
VADSGKRRARALPRDAITYDDVRSALRSQCADILKQIPCENVQLSLPLDGKGPRIRVSVQTVDLDRIPDTVEVTIRRRRLAVPLEAVDDYEAFKAQ